MEAAKSVEARTLLVVGGSVLAFVGGLYLRDLTSYSNTTGEIFPGLRLVWPLAVPVGVSLAAYGVSRGNGLTSRPLLWSGVLMLLIGLVHLFWTPPIYGGGETGAMVSGSVFLYVGLGGLVVTLVCLAARAMRPSE